MADKKQAVYKPTKAEQEFLNRVKKDYQSTVIERSRAYECLHSSQSGARSINQFIKDCRRSYNGFAPRDGSKKAWRSNIYFNETRNKVLATAAAFLGIGVGLEFKAVDKSDRRDRTLSRVMEDGYEWSTERDDFDFTVLKAFMEMIITGTSHILEEIVWEERKVKSIKDFDPKTGAVETEEKVYVGFKGAKAEFIPNEEIHIANFYINDIQEQPFVIRRKVTSYASAEALFGKWKNWKYVMPGSVYFLPSLDSENTEVDVENIDNKAEIIYYWNKPEDRMGLIVNSVLLTPPNYPFPYPHKNYPIAKSIFEPFADQRFYWGNSLVNKELDPQYVINYLIRHFIDSSGLELRPPLFGSNSELSGADLIVPGVYAEMPPGTEVRTIPEIARGVSSSAFNIFQLITDLINKSSIDPLVSGQQATGSPTATEVNAIVGSAQQMKGLNAQFIGHLLVSHARLRNPNILWLVTHDKDFSEIVRHDVRVSNGGKGIRIIRFSDSGDIPVKKHSAMQKILQEKIKLEEESGVGHDIIVVNKDNIEDYRYLVSVSAVPKQRENSAMRISRAIQKYQLLSKNPLVDMKELTEDVIESWGDDPDEYMQDTAKDEDALAAGAPILTPQTVQAGAISGSSGKPNDIMSMLMQ